MARRKSTSTRKKSKSSKSKSGRKSKVGNGAKLRKLTFQGTLGSKAAEVKLRTLLKGKPKTVSIGGVNVRIDEFGLPEKQ